MRQLREQLARRRTRRAAAAAVSSSARAGPAAASASLGGGTAGGTAATNLRIRAWSAESMCGVGVGCAAAPAAGAARRSHRWPSTTRSGAAAAAAGSARAPHAGRGATAPPPRARWRNRRRRSPGRRGGGGAAAAGGRGRGSPAARARVALAVALQHHLGERRQPRYSASCRRRPRCRAPRSATRAGAPWHCTSPARLSIRLYPSSEPPRLPERRRAVDHPDAVAREVEDLELAERVQALHHLDLVRRQVERAQPHERLEVRDHDALEQEVERAQRRRRRIVQLGERRDARVVERELRHRGRRLVGEGRRARRAARWRGAALSTGAGGRRDRAQITAARFELAGALDRVRRLGVGFLGAGDIGDAPRRGDPAARRRAAWLTVELQGERRERCARRSARRRRRAYGAEIRAEDWHRGGNFGRLRAHERGDASAIRADDSRHRAESTCSSRPVGCTARAKSPPRRGRSRRRRACAACRRAYIPRAAASRIREMVQTEVIGPALRGRRACHNIRHPEPVAARYPGVIRQIAPHHAYGALASWATSPPP